MLLHIGGKISKQNLQVVFNHLNGNITANAFIQKYNDNTNLFMPFYHGNGIEISIENGKLCIFIKDEDFDLDFEKILQENKVNYDRFSSANEIEEFDSELVKFRDGMESPISCVTDVMGNPVVSMNSISECLKMENVKTMIQTIQAHLRTIYVPELEPLEII